MLRGIASAFGKNRRGTTASVDRGYGGYLGHGTDVAAFHGVMGTDAPLKILAVDNEASVTLSLRYVFNGPRYELTCVDSGHKALAKLDANFDLYDVIIVDEKMPKLTGVELVTAIRQRGINGKIIVLSANLSPQIRESYSRLFVQQMFSKPFNVEELRAAVERIAV